MFASFALYHVGPHQKLAGYLAMVTPNTVEWAEWCLLTQQFFGSGAARSAASIVVGWQCHPSKVSQPMIGEECRHLR